MDVHPTKNVSIGIDPSPNEKTLQEPNPPQVTSKSPAPWSALPPSAFGRPCAASTSRRGNTPPAAGGAAPGQLGAGPCRDPGAALLGWEDTHSEWGP